MLSYEVERTNGSVQRVDDDDGWELLLSSDDVTYPGRIKRFTVRGAKQPIVIDVLPADVLVFKRRTRVAMNIGVLDVVGVQYIIGTRHLDGRENCVKITADGSVVSLSVRKEIPLTTVLASGR